jgi:osmoprotectant transport system substrate-binding protein
MRLRRSGAVGAIVLVMAMVAAACGSGDSANISSSTTVAKTITIGSFNFGESEILANMYKGVLEKAGFTVTMKAKLGNREVVEPALESGQVDLVPEYIGTSLEFLLKKDGKTAGEASGDADATWNKLKTEYKTKNITVLDYSPAADQNAFVVTKATADTNNLKKTSDLAPVAASMVLGGPAECPERPFCQPGLEKTYGLKFKSFKSLDAGGPLTKSALDSGAIQVGLLFSSDGSIAAKGYVVLEDDKHLQTADNVVPVLRSDKASDKAVQELNKVSAALTSDKLAALNKQVDVDKADPAEVATTFLKDNKLI